MTSQREDVAPAPRVETQLPTSAPQSRRGRSLGARRRRQGLTLFAPTLIVVAFVVVIPFFWTLLLSLQEIRLIDLHGINPFTAEYTLANFFSILSSSRFWASTRATLAYTVFGTLGSVGVGLVAALALRRSFRGLNLLRGALLGPFVMPAVAAAVLWETLLHPQFGWVNAFGTQVLGWDRPISFLSQASMSFQVAGAEASVPVALSTVIAFEIWRSFPFAFIFILARLQAMPGDLDEAAQVDGATLSQRFRYIVLPQLQTILAILLLLRAMFIFQNFTDIFVLTGGAGNTRVYSLEVYSYMISRNDIGGAAALGLVMAALISGLLLLYIRYTARQERISHG